MLKHEKRQPNTVMHKLINYSLFYIIILLAACTLPTGLEPVSGVEGYLQVADSTFYSGDIKAIALIVLDRLDLDHLADHFVTYGDPILPCESNIPCDSLNYFFIQLPPGGYLLAPVGLLIPPEKLITDLDSILADPLSYIKLPGSTDIKTVLIREKEITAQDVTW
ncbi:MAG: hypothetical protein HQ562_05905 [Candidatus Marinimicrobia bacterium]|nr:hypothetical protein [Candidatus Neomarinimicrobiota bacterium]